MANLIANPEELYVANVDEVLLLDISKNEVLEKYSLKFFGNIVRLVKEKHLPF